MELENFTSVEIKRGKDEEGRFACKTIKIEKRSSSAMFNCFGIIDKHNESIKMVKEDELS